MASFRLPNLLRLLPSLTPGLGTHGDHDIYAQIYCGSSAGRGQGHRLLCDHLSVSLLGTVQQESRGRAVEDTSSLCPAVSVLAMLDLALLESSCLWAAMSEKGYN